MAKPILDVEIDPSGKFKAFADLHAKYLENLQKMPGAWAGVDKSVKTSFEAVTAAMFAQKELARREAAAEKELARGGKVAGAAWSTVALKSKEVLGNVKNITLSLLRWASLGTVFTGLLGGGGLFGLDRLAGNVGANRRAALGLGVSYGERKAFDVNYGRVVDSEGYLSSVNSALHDASLRGKLYGAGLGENQLKGSTADVSVRLLQQIKAIADRTPQALLAQTMSARGLDQFVSLQEFERIKATPKGELAGYAGAFGRDKNSFGLDAKAQLAWQNFSVQMNRAGQKIENVFVAGLGRAHIPEALDKLSDAFAKSVETFMSSPDLGKWLKTVSDGIQGFAGYVGSGKFQTDISDFTKNVGDLVSGTAEFVRWVRSFGHNDSSKPSGPGNPRPIVTSAGPLSFLQSLKGRAIDNGLYGDRPVNNPGNLRPVGATKGFRQFSSIEQGVIGLAKDLRYKEEKRKLDTIEKIIGVYAPKNENDTTAYIKRVAGDTGFKSDQHLNLGDNTVLSKLMAAMLKVESPSAAKKLPQKVIVEILNNTGGNAVVTASQLPQ